jgi:hypothetical protein
MISCVTLLQGLSCQEQQLTLNRDQTREMGFCVAVGNGKEGACSSKRLTFQRTKYSIS